MKTQDYAVLGAIALGAFYLYGKMNKNIAGGVGEGIGRGAASATADLGVGAVRGVASVIPAANTSGPDMGVGNWSIPTIGGYVQGNPLQLATASLTNPVIGWNMLPYLPDITENPFQNKEAAYATQRIGNGQTFQEQMKNEKYTFATNPTNLSPKTYMGTASTVAAPVHTSQQLPTAIGFPFNILGFSIPKLW
jgi:hypothetical protein